MKFSKAGLISVLFFSVTILLLTGCKGKNKGSDADVVGYQCQKCKVKFYTDVDVLPDFCPSCKAKEVTSVIGFICSKDSHVTIPSAGDRAFDGNRIKCEKCGTISEIMSHPSASDLQAWGATKKTKKEVCSN